MKKNIFILFLIVILIATNIAWFLVKQVTLSPEPTPEPSVHVTTFAECVAAGYPVMESYPRQCRAEGRTFKEDVGNAPEKTDLIVLTSPLPNTTVNNPLLITGKARGTWFFEASFPVYLLDSHGNMLGQGIAQAQGDWMTSNFVPFTATIAFTTNPQLQGDIGSLVLQKDNPSGLHENEDALKIPVIIGK